MICAGCSKNADIEFAGGPAYEGIPAGLLERCKVEDIRLMTVADIIASREIYVEAFRICAARVDAIRDHDREAREHYGR